MNYCEKHGGHWRCTAKSMGKMVTCDHFKIDHVVGVWCHYMTKNGNCKSKGARDEAKRSIVRVPKES